MDQKKYIICTTPRSGSNLLCGLLSSSNKMGNPSEYLNPWGSFIPLAKNNHLLDSQGRISMEAYLKYFIEKKSTSNGCFGLKLLFGQLERFGEFQAVKDFLQQSRYIWLVRQDTIAQAVSLYIATETDAWKSFTEEKKSREKLEYNEKKIYDYIEKIIRHNLEWKKFFLVNQIEYLQVNYEDLIVTPQTICQKICNFCGIETDHQFLIDKVQFKKQGDSLNEEFASIFRENHIFNHKNGKSNNHINIKGIKVFD